MYSVTIKYFKTLELIHFQKNSQAKAKQGQINARLKETLLSTKVNIHMVMAKFLTHSSLQI